MRYIVVFFILFSVASIARDNPFEAVNTKPDPVEKTVKKTKPTTPEVKITEAFSTLTTKLPSSARVLKSVEFKYQNEDGSIESKNININNTIDWHDGLLITKANVAVKAKSELKLKLTRKPPVIIDFKDMVRFVVAEKSIFVRTKDRKIRDYLVTKPYKIVIDFAKKTSFYTKEYSLKNKYFESIKLGRHKGYYRVVIQLSGKYKYSKEKVKDGYIFSVI